jgi:hypothetical protein
LSDHRPTTLDASLNRIRASRLTLVWDRVERGVKGVSMALPTFFRACCAEASRGGAQSYADAGWHLANSLGRYDDDLSEADWAETVKDLVAALRQDDNAVWQWFDDHMPRCAGRVPLKRRAKFVEGVRRAQFDGRDLPRVFVPDVML